MLQQAVYKVFLKYTIPSVLGLLSISSAAIVDGYFIGNYVGHVALASVNIVYPIFALLLGFALMFAVGNSVVFSKLFGEKRVQEGLNIFSKTLLVMVFFSIFTCILFLINLDNYFHFMGVDGELRYSAKLYLSIVLLFLPFLMVGIVIDYFVRADENPNLSFLAMFLSSIINAMFDYLFIVVFDFGIQGAAYATAISHFSIIFILLPHFFTKKHHLKLIYPSGSFLSIFRALKNGLSEFVNESSAGITVFIFNLVIIKFLGEEGISAYAIVSYFLMINIMISFGIGDGLQPIIAKHFGAKKFHRIHLFMRLGLQVITIFSLTFVLLAFFYPEFFVSLFLDEKNLKVENTTIDFLRYTWIAFLFIGINILITSYLTSIHQAFASATISILRSLIFPILFVVLFSKIFGIIGIYITLACSEFIAFIVAIYFFKKYQVREKE